MTLIFLFLLLSFILKSSMSLTVSNYNLLLTKGNLLLLHKNKKRRKESMTQLIYYKANWHNTNSQCHSILPLPPPPFVATLLPCWSLLVRPITMDRVFVCHVVRSRDSAIKILIHIMSRSAISTTTVLHHLTTIIIIRH